MSSYILKINESVPFGKILLDYLKSLSKTNDCVDIMIESDRPYNPEFVEKILRADRSDGVKIKREDLWK